MTMKINSLQFENVKRIKAVQFKPAENGLTIIGGDNEQGKTSILDAIACALGGEKYRPSKAGRDGSVLPPMLKVIMNNGLVVERKGKNSELKVTDPSGRKAGQTLLNEFIDELALNLPKFMEASGKEKANTLLQIIGVGDQLAELELKEKELYQERLYTGRTADQKKKFAAEQPYYPDAPEEPVSPSDLIRQQQEILARNGRNQEYRMNAERLAAAVHNRKLEIKAKEEQMQRILDYVKEQQEALAADEEALEAAMKTAEELRDESTAELEESIANIEEINRKVRANLDKAKAEDDAKEYTDKYNLLTQEIEDVRRQKTDLLEGAQLPLPGLSVEDGELTYNGQKWDNMSGSQRLVVSTAIVRKLNPKCGFVLMDKLEQMDLKTLKEFGKWLEAEGLQAIATRVSTGDECSIIIEDGYAKAETATEHAAFVPRKWEEEDI